MGPVGTLEYHNFARTENRKNPSILFSCGLSNKLQRTMERMRWTCKRTQLELITLVYITSIFYKEDFVQTK
jgi:hypothetical protein